MGRPLPSPERPILLVGMPGVGKTTVGRLLAARLGLPFHDLDAAVVTARGMSIARIFAEAGEPAFRQAEQAALERLLGGPAAVIAAGGGAFADPATRSLARLRARTVWLDAPIRILIQRLGDGGDRPLLAGNAAAGLERLWRERKADYGEAEVRVDASGEPDAVAALIAAALAST